VHIQHIALAETWADAQLAGTYTVSTLGLELADVGFIHCSRPEQLEDVFEHFYADVTEPLLLLTIDTDLLTSPWQLDDVPGEALSFPHIYGPLNTSAVVSAEPLRSSASS
jgi:glutathione S-transferase